MRTFVISLAFAAAMACAGDILVRVRQDQRLQSGIGHLTSAGDSPLPVLMKGLSRQDSKCEEVYAWICAELPDRISRHLPEPCSAAIVRLNAAAAVGQLGPGARTAVPQLIKLLRDDAADANAAYSLALIGPTASESIQALAVAVKEQRLGAATALGRMGPAAKEARPALQEACSAGPEWLRHESALALRKIGEDLSAQNSTGQP